MCYPENLGEGKHLLTPEHDLYFHLGLALEALGDAPGARRAPVAGLRELRHRYGRGIVAGPWIGRSLERAPRTRCVAERLQGESEVEVQVVLGRQEVLPLAQVLWVTHCGRDMLARLGRLSPVKRRLGNAKVGADVLARDETLASLPWVEAPRREEGERICMPAEIVVQRRQLH